MKKDSFSIFSIKAGNLLFFVTLLFCYYIMRTVYMVTEHQRGETISLGVILFAIILVSFGMGYKVLTRPGKKVIGDYFLTALVFVIYLVFHLFVAQNFIVAEVFASTAALLISTSFILLDSNQKLNNYLAVVFFAFFTYMFIYYRIIEPRLLILDEEKTAQFVNSIYYVLCLLPFLLYFKWKYIAIVVVLFCTLISGKIGAITGLLLGFLVYFYVQQKVQGKKIEKHFWVLIIFTAILILIYNKVATELEIDIMDKISENDGTGSGRTTLYGKVLGAYFNSSIISMIVGNGPNAVANFMVFSAHNDFLEVLYDYGLIGEIIYLRFVYLLFKMLSVMIKARSEDAAPYAFALSLFIVMSLISNVLFITRYGLFLFSFFGMTIYRLRSTCSTMTSGAKALLYK